MEYNEGEVYKFENNELPEHNTVIEVCNPNNVWLEVLFVRDDNKNWRLVFNDDDVVTPEEALEVFPQWRREHLKIMIK